MKKYPYTDSTEIIMYEPKKKKHRNFKKFVPCILSAVLASVITAGAVGVGGYYYLKPLAAQSVAYTGTANGGTSSNGASTVLSDTDMSQQAISFLTRVSASI